MGVIKGTCTSGLCLSVTSNLAHTRWVLSLSHGHFLKYQLIILRSLITFLSKVFHFPFLNDQYRLPPPAGMERSCVSRTRNTLVLAGCRLWSLQCFQVQHRWGNSRHNFFDFGVGVTRDLLEEPLVYLTVITSLKDLHRLTSHVTHRVVNLSAGSKCTHRAHRKRMASVHTMYRFNKYHECPGATVTPYGFLCRFLGL